MTSGQLILNVHSCMWWIFVTFWIPSILCLCIPLLCKVEPVSYSQNWKMPNIYFPRTPCVWEWGRPWFYHSLRLVAYTKSEMNDVKRKGTQRIHHDKSSLTTAAAGVVLVAPLSSALMLLMVEVMSRAVAIGSHKTSSVTSVLVMIPGSVASGICELLNIF